MRISGKRWERQIKQLRKAANMASIRIRVRQQMHRRLTTRKELFIALGHLLVCLLAIFEDLSGPDVRFVVSAILLLKSLVQFKQSSHTTRRRVYCMLDYELLADIFEVSFTHAFEAIANFLLYQLIIFFRERRESARFSCLSG